MMALIPAYTQIATQPRDRASLESGLSSSTPLQTDISPDVVTERSFESGPVAPSPHRADNPALYVADRNVVSVSKYPSSLCSCRPRKNVLESKFCLGPVVLLRSTEVMQQHREDCLYYLPPQGSKEQFGFTFRVGTNSRRWDSKTAVNYNFSVGTFSVSPTVTFKSTVSWDHPPFSTLVVEGKSFERKTADLMKMFREGRGSPTDTGPDGKTLLHVGYSQCERNQYITNTYKILFMSFSFEGQRTQGALLNEAYFHDFQKCVSTLRALGVPKNEVDI